MRALAFAAFALAWACPARVQATPAQKPAAALERFGLYDEAAARYEGQVAEKPEDLAALKDLMWAYWNGRRFEKAREIAARVLAREPRDREALDVAREAGPTSAAERAPLLWMRAAQAWREDRGEEAVALYKHVIDLQPHDVLSLKDLMWALWRLDRIEDAMALARRVLVLRPTDRESAELLKLGPRLLEERLIAKLLAQAEALIADDRFNEAVEPLLDIVGRRPRRAAYQRLLVYALSKADRLEEALSAAARMTRDFPKDAAAWTVLGDLQVRRGDRRAARASFERALALDTGQWRAALALADLLLRERDFAGVERLLRPYEDAEEPRAARAVPWLLGQALFWQHSLEEALDRFDDAARYFPDRPDYGYYRAWTLLRLGRAEAGRAALARLAAKGHKKSFTLLLDEAVARGDLDAALAVAEPALRDLAWSDEGLALRAAALLEKAGRPGRARALLGRLVKVLPESQGAWLAKGRLELARGRLGAAVRAGERARRLNPAAREPHMLLARAAAAAKIPRRAERRLRAPLKSEPTRPENVLASARAAYAAGLRDKARRLVDEWLARNEGPALPVLLYHGLARTKDDPMLAYRYHHEARVFEDHMRGLKEAGYSAVTVGQAADWLEGKADLPPKAVLVTFDDGLSDSLELADPALARHGMKAVMMVGAASVDAHAHPEPANATWAQLLAWRETGRWELESQGSGARLTIPIDARGRGGMFLVNRRWDEKAGALEAPGAWRARLEAEYADGRRALAERLGRPPAAFAYPEGAAGHKADVSNAPDALDANRALVAERYRLAFAQDASGVNTRGRDPRALSRLEPDNRWSGEELVRRLNAASPVAAAYIAKLDWAVAERDFPEARRLLAKLESLGVERSTLLAKEAAIRYYAGELERGRALAREAVGLDGSAEAAALLERAEADAAPYWSPDYRFYGDNQERRSWSLAQRLDFGRHGLFRPRAEYRRSELAQTDGPVVVGNSTGAGVDVAVHRAHTLTLDAFEHFFEGAADVFAAEAGLSSRWGEGLTTRLEASRTPMFTARALARGTTRRGVDFSARLAPSEPWTARLRLQRDWFSDDNARTTAQAEAARDVASFDRLVLRGVYRFVYDAARRPSPDYFAPSDFTMHSLGPEASLALTKSSRLTARWLPTRAVESGGSAIVIHQARAAFTTQWRRADSLEIGVDLNRAPRYRALGLSATATVRF